jgi:hypothetical protein
VNLTVVTAYETAWADLSNIKPVLNQRASDKSSEQINWKNTWAVLKKLQGKRCTSMIRSKTLIFRIKCLNKLLPTKDICFQRDPALYQSKTCIACFASEETLEHLAECQIYQRIWKNTESIIMGELEIKLLEKWKLDIPSQKLEEIFLGLNLEDKLRRRKLHIRGLTSKNLMTKAKEVLGSGSKASKAICWFIEIFWSNFFERLWKFRCEVMVEWEKRNKIGLKEKRKKITKKNAKLKNRVRRSRGTANKENQIVGEKQSKETVKERDWRNQKVAEERLSNWIEGGMKDSWLSFKSN